MSAMICQSTALRAPFTDMDTSEFIPGKDDALQSKYMVHKSNESLLESVLKRISYFTDSKQHHLSMERRQFDEPSTSNDASLCFFFQEKDESSHISCKQRLTRSKFNYNPFGLRFGKRNEATTTDSDRPKQLLPMMLYLRKQLETSWKPPFYPMEECGLLGWKLWVIVSGTLCLLLCFIISQSWNFMAHLFHWVLVFVQ